MKEGKLTFSIKLLTIILVRYLILFPSQFPRIMKGLFVGEVLSRDEKKMFRKIVSDISHPVVKQVRNDCKPYHGPYPMWFHLRLTGEFAISLSKSFGIRDVKSFVMGALIHDIHSDMGDTRRTMVIAKELELPEDVCYAIKAHMALFAKYPPVTPMDWCMVMRDWYSHILDMVMTVFHLIAHPNKMLWFFKQLVWEGFIREFFVPHLEKH